MRKLFDFNGDGAVSAWEMAMGLAMLEELEKEEAEEDEDDEDEEKE